MHAVATFVHEVVAPVAQEDQVVDVGRSAERPVPDVVGLAERDTGATPATPTVAGLEQRPLSWAGEAP